MRSAVAGTRHKMPRELVLDADHLSRAAGGGTSIAWQGRYSRKGLRRPRQ